MRVTLSVLSALAVLSSSSPVSALPTISELVARGAGGFYSLITAPSSNAQFLGLGNLSIVPGNSNAATFVVVDPNTTEHQTTACKFVYYGSENETTPMNVNFHCDQETYQFKLLNWAGRWRFTVLLSHTVKLTGDTKWLKTAEITYSCPDEEPACAGANFFVAPAKIDRCNQLWQGDHLAGF